MILNELVLDRLVDYCIDLTRCDRGVASFDYYYSPDVDLVLIEHTLFLVRVRNHGSRYMPLNTH